MELIEQKDLIDEDNYQYDYGARYREENLVLLIEGNKTPNGPFGAKLTILTEGIDKKVEFLEFNSQGRIYGYDLKTEKGRHKSLGGNIPNSYKERFRQEFEALKLINKFMMEYPMRFTELFEDKDEFDIKNV